MFSILFITQRVHQDAGPEQHLCTPVMVQYHRKRDAMASLGGVAIISGLYVVGLLACIIVGATSPAIFIENASEFAADDVSRASSSFRFEITNYQVRQRLLSSIPRTGTVSPVLPGNESVNESLNGGRRRGGVEQYPIALSKREKRLSGNGSATSLILLAQLDSLSTAAFASILSHVNES